MTIFAEIFIVKCLLCWSCVYIFLTAHFDVVCNYVRWHNIKIKYQKCLFSMCHLKIISSLLASSSVQQSFRAEHQNTVCQQRANNTSWCLWLGSLVRTARDSFPVLMVGNIRFGYAAVINHINIECNSFDSLTHTHIHAQTHTRTAHI